MLTEATRHTPDTARTEYELTFRELLAAGYTAVGEFHYLGYGEALAAADAARAAGIELVLLHVAYARGGLERFRQASPAAYLRQIEELQGRGIHVGVALHSVRACPSDWLREIGRYAAEAELPLHVHACEQPREIDECIAEHDLRPIELLSETGCLGPRTTVIHATHASDRELDLIASTGARVGLCPSTEADLADGFAPMGRLLEREIALCIGSDSNVLVDPFEELRRLDAIARCESLRRDVLTASELLTIGGANGAASLGLGEWPTIEIDLAHPSLRGVEPTELSAALVAGCSADVVESARDHA